MDAFANGNISKKIQTDIIMKVSKDKDENNAEIESATPAETTAGVV